MSTFVVPEPVRASLSGYVQPGKLLPWQWVATRMEAARNYWITTVTTAYPSSRPVWGIWFDPVLVFSSGSRVARNLRRDDRVQVNLEGADEVVIVEGHAVPLVDEGVGREWVARYLTKYRWKVPDSLVGVYCVEPRRVIAWVSALVYARYARSLRAVSGLDAGAAFANLSTEWRFARAHNG